VGIWQGDTVTHVLTWLAQQASHRIDQCVEITAQRLACRIIAFRVPPSVAEERRKRVREAAKARKNSQLKPQTLALCDWTILVTNLPFDRFTPDDICCLQRLRWQIELLFKLWKNGLSLDEWRSQNPHQILSEVYAKLLLALIQHWCLLLGCWSYENRSLVKACQALRKHAFHLLAVLPHFSALLQALCLILPTLTRCTVQKRKTRPATFQILGRASP
jgi:hypothetical protein